MKKLIIFCMAIAILSMTTYGSSTLTDCYVASSCGSDTVIFSISAQTNAHGATSTSEGGYLRVCCAGSEISNSYIGGARTSEVIRLNDSSNSHGQDPDTGTYNFPVYISTTNPSYNISCDVKSSCSGGEVAVVSLEQTTNSQLGNETAYTNIACCEVQAMSGVDTDADGQLDIFDYLWFDETAVTTTGIGTLNITLDGIDDVNGLVANDSQLLEFYNGVGGDELFFNVTYPFDPNLVDLRNYTIYKTSNYLGIDSVGSVTDLGAINHTLIVDEYPGVVSLCVETADNDHPWDISNACNNFEVVPNTEYDMTPCITNSPYTHPDNSNITCIHAGGKFYITNVMGAEQLDQQGLAQYDIPEFSTVGLVLIAIAFTLMMVLKKKPGKVKKK